jgi:hypothetical protein
MICTPYKSSSGVTAIVCGSGRRKPCQFCKTGVVTKLCDHPVRNGTCDAPMYDRCATNIGSEMDYCPPHARHNKKQQSLFAAEKEER